MTSFSVSGHLVVGLALRIALIAYGNYQDRYSNVPYTDIDYSVYTDASRYILKGESPYSRETYRYTPILAWILTPSLTSFASFGKLLFSLFDVITGWLIYLIVASESKGNQTLSKRCSFCWLYNPLPMVICTRGSSESIILCLVLAFMYMYMKRAFLLSGMLYGLAVHFKIYPVIYCLPIYLTLGPTHGDITQQTMTVLSMLKSFVTPTLSRAKIIIGSLIGFLFPTCLSFWLYKWQFVNETYLYHLTRKDIKHNFSMYFYHLYLGWDEIESSGFSKGLQFFPQIILVVGVALMFQKPRDFVFTIFVQTYCFVVFNKVCTSQYFLWYLSFLPLLSPKLNMKLTHGAILLVVWYFAQISWLLPAYYLEFEGRNTFIYIWLESIAFFCANIGVLTQIVKSYDPMKSSHGN